VKAACAALLLAWGVVASPSVAHGFTDELLVAGSTPIKAVHFVELRTAIDAVRARVGLPPFVYTDRVLAARSSLVRAVDLVQLRTALAQSYSAFSQTLAFRDAIVAGQTVVKAAHLTELRAAVLAAPSFTSTLHATSAPPATPLQIGTTGLVPGASVTVRFSSGPGFSAQSTPLRIGADGTLVVPVPFFVDPQSHAIASGAVDVVVSQTLPSGQVVAAAAQPLTIQGLLDVSSLPLGSVTHRVLTFSALLTENRIDQLLFFTVALGGRVDTVPARQLNVPVREAIVKARADVEKIMADPTRVIAAGTLADGTPVQFNAQSLALMDRILAGWVYELAVLAGAAPPQAARRAPLRWAAEFLDPMDVIPAAWIPPFSLAQAPEPTPIDVVDQYLGQLNNWLSLYGQVGTLASKRADLIDKVLALSGAVQSVLSLTDNPSRTLGLANGMLAPSNATRHIVIDLFENGVNKLLAGTLTEQDADALLTRTACQYFIGMVKAGSAIRSFLYPGLAGSGIGGLGTTALGAMDGCQADDSANQSIAGLATTASAGGWPITGVVEDRTQSGLDLVMATAYPYCASPSFPAGAMTDASGTYKLYVSNDPHGVCSPFVIGFGDLVTEESLGSSTVDLRGVPVGNPVSVPSLVVGLPTLVGHTITSGRPSTCATPARVSTFQTTSSEADVWINVTGVRPGDVIRWEWRKPDGSVYLTNTTNISVTGNYCFWNWMFISGYTPAVTPGAWSVRVLYNGAPFVTENFTIARGQCGGFYEGPNACGPCNSDAECPGFDCYTSIHPAPFCSP